MKPTIEPPTITSSPDGHGGPAMFGAVVWRYSEDQARRDLELYRKHLAEHLQECSCGVCFECEYRKANP